jgi:hypothetical protein
MMRIPEALELQHTVVVSQHDYNDKMAAVMRTSAQLDPQNKSAKGFVANSGGAWIELIVKRCTSNFHVGFCGPSVCSASSIDPTQTWYNMFLLLLYFRHLYLSCAGRTVRMG